jgi:hypothetical protein
VGDRESLAMNCVNEPVGTQPFTLVEDKSQVRRVGNVKRKAKYENIRGPQR